MHRILCALALSLFGAVTASAAPALEARRLEGQIKVDGRLDEPAWAAAPAASAFRQWIPNRGEPARLDTEVRVLYDAASLFVGARMANPGGPARIVGRVHRRDRDSYSDWFGVSVDTEHRGRTARMFRVNAANVQLDLVQVEGRDDDLSWDAVWDSATRVDATGWSAELRIPLELLRPHASSEPQSWGIYFYRENQEPYEVTGWMVVPRGEQGFVSHFYALDGVLVEAPPRRREVVAYGSQRQKLTAVAPYDDLGGTWSAGVDARLGIGQGGQLDISLLPDFGQVEVDRQVLNLSVTETLFPEKRPFFTEGADGFAMPGFTLFYSRRIGRALAPPPVAGNARVVEQPLSAEVLGAARYTHQGVDGWRATLLGAAAGEATATIRSATGTRHEVALAPSQSFGVARVTRQLGGRGTYLGSFAGWTGQHGGEGRTAQVGAVDGAWRSRNGRTELTGIVAGTRAGFEGRERSGWGSNLVLKHTFSVPWTATLNLTELSRRFDPNDLGYLTRPDLRQGWVDFRRVWDRTAGVFRNWEVAFGGNLRKDQSGHTLMREVEATLGTQFTSFWHVTGIVGAELASEDDQELRTFGADRKLYLDRPGRPFALVRFGTPPQAAWSLSGEAWVTRWEGGPTTTVTLTQMIRPSSRFDVELDTGYTRAEGERRWLETPSGGCPVVGLRALSQLDLTARFSYALTPRASVQLFSQWMAANWAYRDLEMWSHGARAAAATAAGPTAFSDRLWNLNLIGRWEYRRGSVAYLVYTRGVVAPAGTPPNDHGGLSPAHDLASLHGLPSQDVVQLKLTWYL